MNCELHLKRTFYFQFVGYGILQVIGNDDIVIHFICQTHNRTKWISNDFFFFLFLFLSTLLRSVCRLYILIRSRAFRKYDASLLQRSGWCIYRFWCVTKWNIWCGHQMETRFRLKSAITQRKSNSLYIDCKQGNTEHFVTFSLIRCHVIRKHVVWHEHNFFSLSYQIMIISNSVIKKSKVLSILRLKWMNMWRSMVLRAGSKRRPKIT